MGSGEGSTMRNFPVCTVHLVESRGLWTRVVRMIEGRRTFKILTGTPTGKKPLGRPRRRWEGSVRMNLK